MSAVEDKIAELGLKLPEVVPPLAAYQPAVRSGDHVFTSGQLPMVDGALPATGKVGADSRSFVSRACAAEFCITR